MRYILICFLFVFFSSSILFADEYFLSKDISDNRYHDTLGYGIGELLESRRCPNCVEYDVSDIYGTYSSSILSNTDISDLTQKDSKYGLVRVPGVYDMVALPPYSSADLIYWSENIGQEDVNISSIKVFFSRRDVSMGDLRQLLYIDGVYETVSIKYLSYNFEREGIVKTYPGLGVVSSGGGKVDGMVLDRVYVRPALEFVKWEADVDDGVAYIRVYVVNTTTDLLNNVVFKHGEYSLKRDFNAYEEYVYEYTLDIDSSESLGYASILDPNIRQECVVVGENISSIVVGQSSIVSGVRESNGEYLSYIGSRTKPWCESFCVTRIPYTLYSGEMVMQKVEGEDEIPEVSAEEVVSEDIGEVFGITKLPQTSVNTINFLVVFLILCYYLLRKTIL